MNATTRLTHSRGEPDNPRMFLLFGVLSSLRQSVVNRCRAVPRCRVVVDELAQKIASDMLDAARDNLTLAERSALVLALANAPAARATGYGAVSCS